MAVTGARGACPACRAALWAPASELLGKHRCPRCGADLWVLVFSRGPVFFPRREGESLAELPIALGGPEVGTDASELEAAIQTTSGPARGRTASAAIFSTGRGLLRCGCG
jgi:hypothetical protein